MGAQIAAAGGVPTAVRYAEVAAPGAAIGLVAGVFAAAVASLAGLPLVQITTIAAALGVPLALFGAGYCALLAAGRFGVGAVGPAALYWLVGFPLARLIDEYAVAQVLGHDSVLREPLPAFLLFQALLSVGFTIGFLWLHERLAPHWFIRIRGHNPVAADLVERYLQQVDALDRRRARAPRARRRDTS
ncbi:hypothetical protein ACFOVU_29140 [Nocardiopsis sediminis]|uniref:Uncharacterized protein n=1 Tax=Nocardiopsis sediminis TaxID=1778267 RepID=A0ABV8FXD9_9ACTN